MRGHICSYAKLTVIDANLTLHNGQFGSAVAQNLQEKAGAFTVANLNDTDNDGGDPQNPTPDAADSDVRAATGGPDGRDELDLMELNIAHPSPDFGGNLRVRVNGNGRLWEQSYKGTEIALSGGAADLPTSTLPRTIWVELPSGSGLRDVEIVSQYMGVNEIDVVKATGIWITAVESKHDAGDTSWGDMTDPPSNWITYFGGYGLRPINPTNGVRNIIGIRYQLAPAGIWGEPNIYFDISRCQRHKTWHKPLGGAWVLDANDPFPDNMEAANDDSVATDESAAPSSSGGFFVVDGPGTGQPWVPPGYEAWAQKGNFNEFLRISFTGRPTGSLSGSRCSPYYPWHSRHRVVDGGSGTWVRSTGDSPESEENDIGTGHITIGTDP